MTSLGPVYSYQAGYKLCMSGNLLGYCIGQPT